MVAKWMDARMQQEVDRVIARPRTAARAAPSSPAAVAAAAAAAALRPLPLRPAAVFSSFHRRSVGRSVGGGKAARSLARKGTMRFAVRPSVRPLVRPPACLTPKSSPSASFPDC